MVPPELQRPYQQWLSVNEMSLHVRERPWPSDPEQAKARLNLEEARILAWRTLVLSLPVLPPTIITPDYERPVGTYRVHYVAARLQTVQRPGIPVLGRLQFDIVDGELIGETYWLHEDAVGEAAQRNAKLLLRQRAGESA